MNIVIIYIYTSWIIKNDINEYFALCCVILYTFCRNKTELESVHSKVWNCKNTQIVPICVYNIILYIFGIQLFGMAVYSTYIIISFWKRKNIENKTIKRETKYQVHNYY